MQRSILILAVIAIAAGDSEAQESSSLADQLNHYSARAVIARSTQPDIFRRIVYKSTGRILLPPARPQMDRFTIPHTPYIRERDPLEGFVATGAPLVYPGKPGRAPGLSEGILDRISQYDPLIKTYSNMNGLDANLIRAVIYVESGGDRNAVSHKGAEGLMQLMPGTASDIGVSNSFDPAQNIYGGTRYLGTLLKRFKRIDLALWGYNAGPESVKRKRLPLTTKLYIPNVLRIKAILDGEGT